MENKNGKPTGRTATEREAYQQGQRDREQGWPDMLSKWEFVGPVEQDAYLEGYANPRKPDTSRS